MCLTSVTESVVANFKEQGDSKADGFKVFHKISEQKTSTQYMILIVHYPLGCEEPVVKRQFTIEEPVPHSKVFPVNFEEKA